MTQDITLTATGINTALLYDSLGRYYTGEYDRALTITTDTDNNQVLRVRSSYGDLTDIILDDDLVLMVDDDYQDFLDGDYTITDGYDFNTIDYDPDQQKLVLSFKTLD